MRRLTILIALALALAACTGGDQAADVTIVAEGDEGAFAPGAAEEIEAFARESGSFDVSFDVPDERQVIRQASLQLEADDTRTTFDRIVAITEESGGFVSNATVYPVEGDDSQPQVVMTLRVPAQQLSATMAAIKGTATEVISESQSAQDVTEQYVDLTAQLTNLKALEVELRALLTEVRQQTDVDPDKLLRVFNEISLVRGQIEQIQGQLNYLDDVVALASLDVQLNPTMATPPIVDGGWEPLEVARDSLTQLVAGVQRLAGWGINFVVLVLPMLLMVLGVPVAVGLFTYRRWWRKEPARPEIPAES